MTSTPHVYEVRPRNDHRGFRLISDVLPFGSLWYSTPDDAIDFAKHRSRAHDAVISVYDAAGKLIENTRTQGRFQRALRATFLSLTTKKVIL